MSHIQNIEAERSIIGSIIVNGNNAFDIASSMIHSDDFTYGLYKTIWDKISQIRQSGLQITPILIHQMLEGTNNYNGFNSLINITENVSVISRLEYDCKNILDCSERRMFCTILDDARELVSSGGSITEAVGKIGSSCISSGNTIISSQEAIAAYEHRVSQGKSLGAYIGSSKLVDMLTFSGLPRGFITVIGAKSSSGKSSLGCQFGEACALNGGTVLDCTFEDDVESRVARSLSRVTGVDNATLQVGIPSDPIVRHAYDVRKKEFSQSNMFYMDNIPKNIDVLIGRIRQLSFTLPIDIVIIDFIQLIPASNKGAMGKDKVDEVFSKLVLLSREMKGTAFLVISQLRKDSNPNTPPTMEDLYESNTLNQWAHTILLIWKPDVDVEEYPGAARCRTIVIAKQKNGLTGKVIVGWDGDHVKFCEPSIEDVRTYKDAVKAMRDKSGTKKSYNSSGKWEGNPHSY